MSSTASRRILLRKDYGTMPPNPLNCYSAIATITESKNSFSTSKTSTPTPKQLYSSDLLVYVNFEVILAIMKHVGAFLKMCYSTLNLNPYFSAIFG